MPSLDLARDNPAIYEKLLQNFPKTSPDAIEACIQCLRIAAYINLQKEELCSQFGLTPGKLSLLMLLWHSPEGALAPSELAEHAGVTRATMTHFLDSLEKDSLIVRESSTSDRRASRVALTAHANRVLKRLLPLHLERMERMVTVLSRTERKQLIASLEKLARAPDGSLRCKK